MEPEDEERDLVRRGARAPALMEGRRRTVEVVAPKLRAAGQLAHLEGNLIGDGRVSGASPRGNGNDALVGVGVLLQIAADLLDAAGALLSGSNLYAGAALLRQVVEVEYLTWAFANNKRDAAAWLNSTEDDRRKLFKPTHLRQISGGHFLAADYGHHCEQGGHPVPRAIPLLANPDPVHAQLLLVDLLLHGWRTSDNVAAWAEAKRATGLQARVGSAQQDFAQWGQVDPLYGWAVAQRGFST